MLLKMKGNRKAMTRYPTMLLKEIGLGRKRKEPPVYFQQDRRWKSDRDKGATGGTHDLYERERVMSKAQKTSLLFTTG